MEHQDLAALGEGWAYFLSGYEVDGGTYVYTKQFGWVPNAPITTCLFFRTRNECEAFIQLAPKGSGGRFINPNFTFIRAIPSAWVLHIIEGQEKEYGTG